jgi:tetratricopeptide (TPR) repeat protein
MATPIVPIATSAVPQPAPTPTPVTPIVAQPAFTQTAPLVAPMQTPSSSKRQQSAPPIDASSPLPPPTAPFRREIISELDDEEAGVPRRAYASMSDAPQSMGKRRSVGGFIVAAVVAGCVAMLVAVWVQKNGLSFGPKPAPSAAPATDPRAMAFLTTGEKALADGNLDLAKESFDKASALAEKDPHVLLDVARLAASRADVLWLKSRLLPSDATDEHKFTRESLGELSQAARKAADDALAVAPDDPGALRAKIDALRISGDRDAPRPLVDRIKSSMAQPETAYVLAALDLAEVEPLWSTVIDRLKVAAAVESGPGRARAALVYALARSGDITGARDELERLKALPRQHPLIPQLAAFITRTQAAGPKVTPSASASAFPIPSGSVAIIDPAHPRPVGGGGDLPRDPRALVGEGEKARVKGDYERAKKAYSAALEQNPNDSEALSGLAAVAYAQRDLAGARTQYKKVLAINPNYTPALVGLGDTEWDSGDRQSAMKIYKDIVERLPEGTYPPRVKQRLEASTPQAPPPPGGDRSDQGGF